MVHDPSSLPKFLVTETGTSCSPTADFAGIRNMDGVDHVPGTILQQKFEIMQINWLGAQLV